MKNILFILILSSMFLGCRESLPRLRTEPYTADELAAAVAQSRQLARRTQPEPPDVDAPTEFVETESGLRYRITRKSQGRRPNAKSWVQVFYKGWLDDGTVFDSSYERGTPNSFNLGNVIAGWQEGLQLIGTNGMIDMEFPAVLGYGATGHPPGIPPNATLHFTVELISVD